MDALKSWGITVCLAALAAGIAGIIAPSGKMEKVYKFAVSLFFLCCLLVPLFNLKNISLGSVNISGADSAANRNLNSTVSEQTADAAEQNVANLVENCCRSYGAVPLKVNVKVAYVDGKLSVSSAGIVLKSSDMQKKEKITEAIKNKLGLDVIIKEAGT